jgi:hypothetical protein
MDFVGGVVGFVGFEALRIYKCLWAKQPVFPLSHRLLYFAVIAFLAIFGGFVASAMAGGNMVEAVFLGFSVPTGLKAAGEDPRKRTQTKDDDVDIKTPGLRQKLWYTLSDYFNW